MANTTTPPTVEDAMTDSNVTDLRPEQGEPILRELPGESASNAAARVPEHGASSAADDPSEAPEEDSQSEIPGDPRPPHQTQPPTKDEY